MTNRKGRGWVFLLPAIFLFVSVYAVPIGILVYYSFFRTNWIETVYVGLDNYRRVIAEPAFLLATRNTLIYSITIGTVGALLAAVVALILYDLPARFKSVSLAVMCSPMLTAGMMISPLIRWVFHPSAEGLANRIMIAFGGVRHDWLGLPGMAIGIIIALCIWSGFGINTVLMVSYLQSVDAEMLEAARCDGAGWWALRRWLFIPLLRPAVIVVWLVTTIGSLFVVEYIFILTRGGPRYGTTNLMYWIVEAALDEGRYGKAFAINVVMIIMAAPILLARKLVK